MNFRNCFGGNFISETYGRFKRFIISVKKKQSRGAIRQVYHHFLYEISKISRRENCVQKVLGCYMPKERKIKCPSLYIYSKKLIYFNF